MGFFDKLFEKKECAFCGGEIGLLGNRKLEDGSMCKACASKLSPWFEDRRHSTVAQIQEQLDYREANKEKVAAFRVTRAFGEGTRILLDEDAGVFMVTSARNYLEENPDVVAFSDVTGCIIDIDESRSEIEREDAQGQMVSYNPPRYHYSYDFYANILVNNPYFDEMRVRLNSSSVEFEDDGRNRWSFGGNKPEDNAEYRGYVAMGEEVKAALLQARQQAREEAAVAAAPKAVVVCQCCGATTTPNASGCCEFCGGPACA